MLRKNDAGEIGFQVRVGGGMGRTPVIGTVVREFLPWQQILVYIEAIVRVYNRYGRRDNMYKARIKILVKAEGQKFIDAVEAEFAGHPRARRRRRGAPPHRGRVRPRRGLLQRCPRGVAPIAERRADLRAPASKPRRLRALARAQRRTRTASRATAR